MKLTRRNLFRRSAEVVGVAAGAVVAAAIPAKMLEAFEGAPSVCVPLQAEALSDFRFRSLGDVVAMEDISADDYGIIHRFAPYKYKSLEQTFKEHDERMTEDLGRAFFKIES